MNQNLKPNIFKIFWLESKYEFFKSLRIPVFAISTIAFPTIFYVMFGLSFNQGLLGKLNTATYYLASYGTFGVIGAALFGFGVGIASERGQGWMRLKRASPMPPLAYFFAKLIMAAIFGAIIVIILLILGILFGGVSLTITQIIKLLAILILGTIPFAAMGMAMGYIAGPNSAPAIVNLVYLPMAFASGLWVPIQFLPKLVKQIAPFLAPYHLSKLALAAVGAKPDQATWQHLGVLAIYTVVFLILAVFLYRRDDGKTYG
ncbi:MAG TPA: ABC transporter permease [Trueperaceae bacterium]|nr:ABC transporter permease [Trueperaceae bacterium]